MGKEAFFEAGEPETRLWLELKKRKWTITTVESCTGGAVSARIVNVAGASDILKQAYVTYCDEAKHCLAGVSRETLDACTAVSAETAKEMALGGARAAGADVCVSVTGLAGPGGGTEEKPVGLVYMACCVKGRTTAERHMFAGDRQQIREQSAQKALELVRACLLKQEDK